MTNNLDLKALRRLLRLLEKRNISEFEFEDEKVKLRLVRGGYAVAAPALAPIRGRSGADRGRACGGGGRRRQRRLHHLAVRRHLLPRALAGRAAVRRGGSAIREGQALCIVEAMKLMNEIEADSAGTIVEILAENGKPVEFGQKLFKVEEEAPEPVGEEPHLFSKVLIANRGEIAMRVIRACRLMGIRTVAIHSEADAGALHVRFADEAVCIGPAEAAKSYLNIPQIIAAAEITGADAIHPGYGFLSENAKFVEVCKKCHIAFIGPTPEAMRLWGDKVSSRAVAQRFGLPLLPGTGVLADAQHAAEQAERVGFPVILKASGGGGGRGMRIVRGEAEIASAPSRPRRARPWPGSRTPTSTWSASSRSRGTSSSRCSPISTARCGPWASASARSSGATRRSSRSRRAPR